MAVLNTMAQAAIDYFAKLWNRGVDIGVGVSTSILVAIIGLLSWKVKLWLDLRADEKKQRLHDRIRKELETADRLRSEREQSRKLFREREDFAALAEKTMDRNAQGAQWELFLEWLKSSGLLTIPANLQTYTSHQNWSTALRNASLDANVPVNARNMANIVRSIEIPSGDEPPRTASTAAK